MAVRNLSAAVAAALIALAGLAAQTLIGLRAGTLGRRGERPHHRYLKAYNETVDWMYSSPDAVPRNIAFSGLSESSVRRMLVDFIPKESLP